MKRNDEQPEPDPREVFVEIRQSIDGMIGALLDLNQAIILSSRKLAQDALSIRNAYVEGAQLCENISRMHGEAARIAAEATGDIISSEWALEPNDDDSDDDDGGDDD